MVEEVEDADEVEDLELEFELSDLDLVFVPGRMRFLVWEDEMVRLSGEAALEYPELYGDELTESVDGRIDWDVYSRDSSG